MKIYEASQLGLGLPLSQEPQARVAACDLAQWSLVLLQRLINLILELSKSMRRELNLNQTSSAYKAI